MIKLLFAAVTALSLAGVSGADAAPKHKRQPLRHHHAPVAYIPAAPALMQTPRPIWAGPAECYTDEGYGRYWPCGAGKDQ